MLSPASSTTTPSTVAAGPASQDSSASQQPTEAPTEAPTGQPTDDAPASALTQPSALLGASGLQLPTQTPAAALAVPVLLGAGLTTRSRPKPTQSGDALGLVRATPQKVVTVRAESPAEQVELTDLASGGALEGYSGALDVVLGAIGTQETWQMAADGACDSRWALALQRLAHLRADAQETYLRFAPEMNGNWQPWSVTPAERTHFSTAWQRWRALQQHHFPTAYAVFCPAHRSTQPYDWTTLLPNADQPEDQIDVLGVAFHPTWLPRTTAEAQRVLTEVDAHGAPVGPEAHRTRSQALGVPLAIAEWTNISEFGPSQALRQAMTDLTSTHRGRGPGQILFDLELTFPV